MFFLLSMIFHRTSNGNISGNQGLPFKSFIRIVQKKRRKYHCGHCSNIFETKDALTSHMQTHVLQKCISVYCPHCQKKFLFRNHKFLMQHIESHKKPGTLEVAQQVQKTPGKTEEDSDGDYYMCNECGKYFTQKRLYEAHLTVHKNEKCECFYCGKVFGAKYSIKEHMRQCVKRTKSERKIEMPTNVKNHKLENVSVQMNCIFQCYYCKEKLNSYEEMKIHMRDVHRKIPQRICGTKINGNEIQKV